MRLSQHILLELFLLESGGGGGNMPPHQNFLSVWMGMVLNMAVNKSLKEIWAESACGTG